jgi:hypothetical protein
MIPKSYTAAWVETDTPPNQTPAFWRISRNGDEKRRKSPIKSFVATDRYTILLQDGHRDLSVERTLAQIENNFVQARNDVEESIPITEAARLDLTLFAAAMLGRTEARGDRWFDALQQIRGFVAQFEGQEGLTQASGSLDFRKLPANAHPTSTQELDAYLTNSIPQLVINSIQAAAPRLYAMKLNIFTTDDEIGFVTSDNPCVMFNPSSNRYHPTQRSPGLAQAEIEVTLPLSPRRLAVFSHKLRLPEYTAISKTTLDALNRRTIFFCDEAFVSRKAEVLSAWHSAEAQPQDAWENRAESALDENDLFTRPKGPMLIEE